MRLTLDCDCLRMKPKRLNRPRGFQLQAFLRYRHLLRLVAHKMRGHLPYQTALAGLTLIHHRHRLIALRLDDALRLGVALLYALG